MPSNTRSVNSFVDAVLPRSRVRTGVGREDSGDVGTYYLAINHDEEMHRPVADGIYMLIDHNAEFVDPARDG